MVLRIDYKENVSKLPSKLSPFLASHKKKVCPRIAMMEKNIFFLFKSGCQLPSLIFLVVHSKIKNQSSDRLVIAHDVRFPFGSTTRNTAFFSFDKPSFTNLSIISYYSHVLEMALFYCISAAQRRC